MSSLPKSASSSSDEDAELRRGPWTVGEDSLLVHYITCHGEGRWNLLAKRSGLRRTGKSCRLRWLNYLKPDVKRGNLTPQEQLMILDLHSKWGNRWSKIAQHLPGRTDNEIKNYWRTRVQKQARHLKIDSNSTAFQEVIQRFWMPRLLQKIQESLASIDTPLQNSAKNQPLNHVTPPQLPPPHHVPIQYPIETSETPQINSSSEKCTSPSISSDSIYISQIPQISDLPTSPFCAMANSDYNQFLKGCCNVDYISYGMEAFSPAAMQPPGDIKDQVGDYNQVENCWIDDDMAHCLWNMDELGQFRLLEEKGR